jgi:outer membrane protein assembly factor BamB
VEYASAVACGQYVYQALKPPAAGKPNEIVCWALTTGEQVYRAQADGVSILSSPIATADGRVYFLGGGKNYVIKSAPEFQVLAANTLAGGNNGSSPAVSGGRIFVRDDSTLFCIGAKQP